MKLTAEQAAAVTGLAPIALDSGAMLSVNRAQSVAAGVCYDMSCSRPLSSQVITTQPRRLSRDPTARRRQGRSKVVITAFAREPVAIVNVAVQICVKDGFLMPA